MSSYFLASSPAKSFRNFSAVIALAAVLAGCQSSSEQGGPIDLGIGEDQSGSQIAAADSGQITDVELRAYCPRVELRDGTAFYNTYERGKQDEADSIIYQASLAEVTRSCNYGSGALQMTVAAAGRVVPGPKSRSGNINMPIRVAVVQGETVLYSKLHKYPVQISDGVGATQFVFNDTEIVIPAPQSRNVTVFIGYDEGPYDTP